MISKEALDVGQRVLLEDWSTLTVISVDEAANGRFCSDHFLEDKRGNLVNLHSCGGKEQPVVGAICGGSRIVKILTKQCVQVAPQTEGEDT